MQVINCVKLAYLAAITLDTFLQNGLVEINEDAGYLKEAVNLHPHAFELFLSISLPLMFSTFILWVGLRDWLPRRRRGRTGLDMVQVTGNEPGCSEVSANTLFQRFMFIICKTSFQCKERPKLLRTYSNKGVPCEFSSSITIVTML